MIVEIIHPATYLSKEYRIAKWRAELESENGLSFYSPWDYGLHFDQSISSINLRQQGFDSSFFNEKYI